MKMKYILNLMLCVVLSGIFSSCSKEENTTQSVIYVTPADLHGTWMLKEWNGQQVDEYIVTAFDGNNLSLTLKEILRMFLCILVVRKFLKMFLMEVKVYNKHIFFKRLNIKSLFNFNLSSIYSVFSKFVFDFFSVLL